MALYTSLPAQTRKQSKLTGRKPRLAISIASISKFFSSHETIVSDSRTWSDLIAKGGAPVISRSIPRLGGLATISDMSFTVPNQGLFSNFLASDPEPENAEVIAYLYFDDGTAVLDAERQQVFKGILGDFPPLDHNSMTFTAKSSDKIRGIKIGTLLTGADAAGAEGGILPTESLGKIAPEVYGNHIFNLANFTASKTTFSREENLVPMVYKGLDDVTGRELWLAAGHELNEIESIWGFDSSLGRVVKATGFTTIQNDVDGAIIRKGATNSFYDFWMPSGLKTEGEAGTGGDGTVTYTNTDNIIDKDNATLGTIATKNASGASSGTPIATFTVGFPKYINSGDIGIVTIWARSSWDDSGVPGGETYTINGEDATGETTEPPTVYTQYGTDAASEAGVQSDVDLVVTAVAPQAPQGTATATVYMIFKRVNYKMVDDHPQLFASIKGKEYDGSITARTQGDEDHFDSGGSGNLIENGAGVVEWILRDNLSLGDSDFNLATFNEASNDLSFSKLSLAILEQVDSDTLIDDILKSLGATIYHDFNDKITMAVLTPHNPFTNSGSFGPSGEDEYNFSPITGFKIVTGKNDAIDFTEGGAELTATLTAGTYTGATLAVEIEIQLEATGADSYTVTYSNSTKKFTIVDDTKNFGIFWFSGSNRGTSAGATLGFTADSLSLGANLLTTGNADSPDDGEGDSVAAWSAIGDMVFSSQTFDGLAAGGTVPAVAFNGAYFVEALSVGGSGSAYQPIVTVNTSRYLFNGNAQSPTGPIKYYIGTSIGGTELIGLTNPEIGVDDEWGLIQTGFTATGILSYVNLFANGVTANFYFDNMECKLLNGATYTSDLEVDENIMQTLPVMKSPRPNIQRSNTEIITDLTVEYNLNYQSGRFQSKTQDTNTDSHAESIIGTPFLNRFSKDDDTNNFLLYFLLSRQHKKYWLSEQTSKLNAIGLELNDKINTRNPVISGIYTDETTKKWRALRQVLNFNTMEVTASAEEV